LGCGLLPGRQVGCEAVDAPVSGGDAGARNATLAIMAGGEARVITALKPLFDTMGSVTHLGPAGSGQSCKIANQVTIATTMVGLVEGTTSIRRAQAAPLQR
jgi:3-hydroxyisobutyrate dehydrogenase